MQTAGNIKTTRIFESNFQLFLSEKTDPVLWFNINYLRNIQIPDEIRYLPKKLTLYYDSILFTLAKFKCFSRFKFFKSNLLAVAKCPMSILPINKVLMQQKNQCQSFLFLSEFLWTSESTLNYQINGKQLISSIL